MHQKSTRSRIAKLAVGALLGSVVSIGAMTGATSASETNDGDSTELESAGGHRWSGGTTTMRSGIRW